MELNGTIRGGVVVLEPGTVVVEGQAVTVILPDPPDDIENMPGFGIWKDRTDLPQDSAEASLELRRRVMRRDL